MKTIAVWAGVLLICGGAMSGYHLVALAGFVLFMSAITFMKGK